MEEKTAQLGTNEYSQQLAERARGLGVTGSGVNAFSNTITSDTLGGSATPLNIPTSTPSTLAAGLSAEASSYGQSAKTQLQETANRQLEEAKIARDTEKKGLLDTMSSYLGIQSSRPEEERKAGLNEKAQKVTQYTNQLEALDRAELNEIRALEGQGLTDAQRSANTRAIQRNYAFQKADVALLQSAANRDYETAFNIVNRKIELQLEPLKTKLEFQTMFYEENRDAFDKAEDRQFSNLIRESGREYDEKKAVEKYKADIALTAVQNGATIPAYVLNELNSAETIDEVAQVLAKNGISLQSVTQRLQEEKARLELQKLREEIDPQNTVTTGTIDDISNILSSNKVGQGTKTSIGTILGVINAVEDMANSNSDGKFTGFNPLAGFTTGFYNTFLPGQPGKPSFLKKDETISNETYLEGINLKIQQWASGAALTEAQTAQVKRMTPAKGDTDRVVKRKLNKLTNFMNQQIKGALMAEGISYDPIPVDLFGEKQSLDAIFSDMSTTTQMTK